MVGSPLRWLLVLLLLGGCATGRSAPTPSGPTAPGVQGFEQKGVASWYGRPHHGRRTASGEIYDMNALTAAHRTLPFGTWVRVTNVETGQSIDVRINDRGPFVRNRVIDLSYAAARGVGVAGRGLATVRLKVIPAPGAAEADERPPPTGERPPPAGE
jgi:rare lipoprotein A